MKTISEFEPDILALVERLRSVPVGETVTYEDLDAVIGRPVRAQRWLMIKARDVLDGEGHIFGTVARVGLKRLESSALPSLGQRARRGIRNRAKRVTARMASGMTRANDVDPETARKLMAEQSVLGLIEFACRDKSMSEAMSQTPLDKPVPLAIAAKGLLAALGVKVNGEP